jgi:Flp pilus assembly pilin Flp
MRELTSVELQAVSGGNSAIEYGLLAALVAIKTIKAPQANGSEALVEHFHQD